jgi:linoleate 10R-lipoxygenase
MLTKLLFRTLPSCYPLGSVYSHFPFLVPRFLKARFTQSYSNQNLVDRYQWTRPPIPRERIIVKSYESVLRVISEEDRYPSECHSRIRTLTKNADLDTDLVCFLEATTIINELVHKRLLQIQQVLFASNNSSEWKLYFRRATEELIYQNSVSPFGSTFKYIDIVRDVVNLLPIYWISSEIVRRITPVLHDFFL